MNRNFKYYNNYYKSNCYKCDKFNKMNCTIYNIYTRLYHTGRILNNISKVCNINKIYCGIRNLM